MNYEDVREKWMNKYPSIEDLRLKTKKRIPNVSWSYLETGTGRETLLDKNIHALDEITLTPKFCKGDLSVKTETDFLGKTYSAPIGVAPVGLTGLMWPKAEILLAKSAARCGIPFCLSTVATETPEDVGPFVQNNGWFQLYPPRQIELRKIFLDRAKNSGFSTLIVTVDIPIPSRRERTKRAGLSTPPKMTPGFLWDGITHPVWSYHTLKRGLPKLRMVEGYSEFKSMMSVGAFVRRKLGGNISWEMCKELRDLWEGPMIVKGLLHPEDAEEAVKIGADAIVVSNHGARQFDGAPTSIEALPEIVRLVKGRTGIIFDSGIRSGLDILKALSLGAEFVLCGRAFIYGVAALGALGGDHAFGILKDELINNMMQLGVEDLSLLPSH